MAHVYLKVEFATGLVAYQEVDPGMMVVERYRDASGEVLFEQPPVGVACWVVDESPEPLPWMDLAEG